MGGNHRQKTKVSTGRVVRRPRLEVSAFRGEWVALDPKTYEVIGHGPSLEKARQSTPNITQLEPVLYFVPKSDAFFVGRAQ
ncbi:MAG TPA: hypothetical protein VGX78_15370, partial [Pirellulales bacterium]|jgi:hypothetical protein|nr:hypothetical protein [Pirellulales bacterium]